MDEQEHIFHKKTTHFSLLSHTSHSIKMLCMKRIRPQKTHHPSRREVRFVKIQPQNQERLLKSVDNGSVSRLLLEAAVEEKRAVALSPGLAVGNTPLGDTDTVLAPARSSSVMAHSGAAAQTALKAAGTLSGLLKEPDLPRVEVVVVDVELGVGVGGAGGLEGNADVVLTENLHEDVLAESAVLVEGLVNDVPGVDLALEVGHDLGDVVLHDVGEGGLVVNVLDPLGKLRVPDKGVATDEVAVLAGEVDKVVTTSEVEVALAALGSIPLHGVLGGKLTKVGLDDGSSLSVAQSTLVTASTEVLLALGLEELVKAVSRLGRAGLVAGRDGSLGRSRAGLNGSSSRSGSGGGTRDTLRVPGIGLGTVVASNTGGRAGEALATALSVGISSLDVSGASRCQRCRKDNGGKSGGRDIHLETSNLSLDGGHPGLSVGSRSGCSGSRTSPVITRAINRTPGASKVNSCS
ncbi:family 10 xylanase, partial [Aureobasidium melanogenum]